jgi:hypothetical protein
MTPEKAGVTTMKMSGIVFLNEKEAGAASDRGGLVCLRGQGE